MPSVGCVVSDFGSGDEGHLDEAGLLVPSQTNVKCKLLDGVHFHSLDSHDEFILWDVQPRFLVMYDMDVSFMRQIEVFKVRC